MHTLSRKIAFPVSKADLQGVHVYKDDRMRLFGYFIILFLSILLTACAAQRWPVPQDGQMVSDLPIVQQRYTAASTKSLGTSQDIADIKHRVRLEPLNPKEIRWLSPTEVMVLADGGRGLGYTQYLCVLVKKDGRWRMVESYLALVS